MRVSSPSAGFLALALLLWPGVALAQGKPKPLVPQIILPGDAAKAPARPAPPGDGAAGGAISVDVLEAVGPDSAGTLDDGNGGLGGDMWAGSDRGLVEALLIRLPTAAASPAMRDMMRRLLLTAARPPEGPAGEESLLALRIGRLVALGDFAGLDALLAHSSARRDDPPIAAARLERRLLAGDSKGACEIVAANPDLRAGEKWHKAALYCQILAGDTAGAHLALSVMAEEGLLDADPLFAHLARRLSAEKTDAPAAAEAAAGDMTVAEPGGLHLAMMGSLGIVPGEEILAASDPGVLRAVALRADVAEEVRLVAAERAVLAGALTPEELGAVYAATLFSAEELDGALGLAAESYGPRARALLYRAAAETNVAAARAAVLEKAWALSYGTADYAVAVHGTLPALATLPPSADLVWFAPAAARALFAAGEGDKAMEWYRLVQRQGAVDPDMAAAAVALWPLVRLADPGGKTRWESETFEAWRAANGARGGGAPDRAAERASTLYALLHAVGEELPEGLWSDMIEAPVLAEARVPGFAIWRGLEHAAESGRRGETVLYALLALGTAGPAEADSSTLARVVPALKRIGLEREARAVAVEAAVGQGL